MVANRARKFSVKSVQAPIGGENDRDAIAAMPEADAIELVNSFPGTSSVDTRGGSVEHSTGYPAIGESLLPYNGVAVSKMFAASGGSIYDATASGAVGAAVATGLSNARWDSINFGGAAGNFLVAVNGLDLAQFYNGVSWQASGTGYATAITGISSTTFSQVNVWKNRLFFVQKGTLKCWYLGVQAIGGAATAIDFSGVAKLGGKLVATATVSSSAGNTLDDYLVAITDQGELLVYQGTDPANASTFGIVGNFRMGRPIANGSDNQGGRFLVRVSSQLIAITVNGFVNIQDAINQDVVANRASINDKIVNAVNADVNSYKDNFGWQCTLFPIQNKLVINIPIAQGSVYKQRVMNTITGSWCTYKGWNLSCMAYFNDNLYGFIGNKIYRLDVEDSNDFVSVSSAGVTIEATGKTAFTYCDTYQNKVFHLARMLTRGKSSAQTGLSLDVDFKDVEPYSAVSSSTNSVSRFDVARFDVDVFSSEDAYNQEWQDVSGIGYAVALKWRLSASQETHRFQAWEISYGVGGII